MHRFNFFLFFFCVVPKTPEGKRAFPEQVEGWIRSERLIKLAHSWFLTRSIMVLCVLS